MTVNKINAYLFTHACHLQIGWYNDQLVHKTFNLPHPYDTLALVIVSTPLMFDHGFKPFIKETSCIGGRDPLDEFMARMLAKVQSEFTQHEIEVIHDFEMHPGSRRPKVLVQTAAHVAGAAYYYQRDSVLRDPWDEKTKICGVSVHAKYGGWFAMRGLVIFKDILVPDLPKKDPVDVVQGDEKRIELLEKFNFHWKDWSFRDVVPSDVKYSEEQKKYFATLPADRKELLDSYRIKDGAPVE